MSPRDDFVVPPRIPKLAYRNLLPHSDSQPSLSKPQSTGDKEAVNDELKSPEPVVHRSNESQQSSGRRSSSDRETASSKSGSIHAEPTANEQMRAQAKKKTRSIFDFVKLKEPSSNALAQFAEAQRKQATEKGNKQVVGLPGVSKQKLPSGVPKVTSKWNGLPSKPSSTNPDGRASSGYDREMSGAMPSTSRLSLSTSSSRSSGSPHIPSKVRKKSVAVAPWLEDEPAVMAKSIQNAALHQAAAKSYVSLNESAESTSSLPEMTSFFPSSQQPPIDATSSRPPETHSSASPLPPSTSQQSPTTTDRPATSSIADTNTTNTTDSGRKEEPSGINSTSGMTSGQMAFSSSFSQISPPPQTNGIPSLQARSGAEAPATPPPSSKLLRPLAPIQVPDHHTFKKHPADMPCTPGSLFDPEFSVSRMSTASGSTYLSLLSGPPAARAELQSPRDISEVYVSPELITDDLSSPRSLPRVQEEPPQTPRQTRHERQKSSKSSGSFSLFPKTEENKSPKTPKEVLQDVVPNNVYSPKRTASQRASPGQPLIHGTMFPAPPTGVPNFSRPRDPNHSRADSKDSDATAVSPTQDETQTLAEQMELTFDIKSEKLEPLDALPEPSPNREGDGVEEKQAPSRMLSLKKSFRRSVFPNTLIRASD